MKKKTLSLQVTLLVGVPEVPTRSEENWRENKYSPPPPKSFIINDAHEDKTKVDTLPNLYIDRIIKSTLKRESVYVVHKM